MSRDFNRFNETQAEDLLTLQAELVEVLMDYSDKLYDIIYDCAEYVQQQMLEEGKITEQKVLVDEDYLDNSVIYTKNGIGILQFNINND